MANDLKKLSYNDNLIYLIGLSHIATKDSHSKHEVLEAVEHYGNVMQKIVDLTDDSDLFQAFERVRLRRMGFTYTTPEEEDILKLIDFWHELRGVIGEIDY
jgi:hypothetical protein